ncbi:putative multidrug resistance protein norM [Xenorhabdus innexi]|uniref:Multidrug-efflux transporter n=2 Tax=Xenorhabdus innexi TaxID=290109 RepID=A0A1N6MVH5_9GAMM|nr:NorM [Xenorhabdus innexi]SIP72858.1 putative multidrug resistance protein norM [Xenorhabdus innexi]
MKKTTLLNEFKYLFLLSTPIIITQLARMSMSAVDAIVSGHYSTNDLAAVSLGSSIWFPIFVLGFGVIIMLSADVAKHRANNDTDGIKESVNNYIYAALILSVPIIIFLLLAVQILYFIGIDENVVDITKNYITAMAFGVPGLMIFNVFRSLLQGLENTKVAMYISIFSFLVNIPLNYIFVFGKFGVPEMGGVGAGITTAVINTFSAVLLIVYFLKNKGYEKYRVKLSLKFSPELKNLFAIGIPSGLAIFVETIFIDVISLGIATLGPVYIAAHNIMFIMTAMVLTIGGGISSVTTVRISYLNAIKDYAATLRFSLLSLTSGVLITFLLGIIFYLYVDSIIGLYTNDLLVIKIAIGITLFLFIFQFIDTIHFILAGILRGFHETKVVFYVPIFGYWVIGVPLAFTLGLTDFITEKMGLVGFWYGLVFGLLTNCITLSIILRLKFKRLLKSV